MDPYIYQYALSVPIFSVGLYFGYKHGYIGFQGTALRNLVIMLAGLLFFMVVQGYLQYAPMDEASPVSFVGDPTAHKQRTIGQPIDYAVMGLYLVLVLVIGVFFGRRQKTTKDFFFGGQRFAWWLIAFSLIATVVGSYSFVKYSHSAYVYGISSSQSYLNDWPLMPLLLFGWLPILYYSRITSVPEYFGRRFNPTVRLFATVSVLVYLISYVGVNLFTMGTVLNSLLGWDIWTAAIVVATISAIYVTFGGQTSVIMTDLFQGVMLLATGVVLLGLAIHYVGGLETFWEYLPRDHRRAFSGFNSDPSFPAVGIYWQDGVANSAFFYFLNQGILMRFMAAKSVPEARKAAMFMPLVLMPVAACVVASGGWIGRAFVTAGIFPELEPRDAFYIAAEFLSKPGIFGLILAALTAALMSTVDTLITAVASVAVNDVYKPYVKPAATESEMLRVARFCSVGVTILGILLVPVYAGFKTIYSAHGAMTAAVTPPLVVTLLLAIFWRRFTATAALWTIAGGSAAILLSIFIPDLVAPFAHGVPAAPSDGGFFDGIKQYKFMRAFYGLSVSATLGVVVTLLTKPEPEEKQKGLVWGTIASAIEWYKGSPGKEESGVSAEARPFLLDAEAPFQGEAQLPVVNITLPVAKELGAGPADLVYVTDSRWWFGGLRAVQAVVGTVLEGNDARVELGPDTFPLVVSGSRKGHPLRIERLQ